MKNCIKITVLVLTISALPLNASAAARVEIAGVHFERSHQLPAGDLPLRGKALLRYMVFIKAYVGALYLPDDVDYRQVLEPVPRRLELSYFHQISAADFAKATRKKMEDNVTPLEMVRLSERLERFNAFYRDVEPGDRYAITYVPTQGTSLSLNGRELGIVEGDDFAAALFAIWLGPQPIDKSFKLALLGQT